MRQWSPTKKKILIFRSIFIVFSVAFFLSDRQAHFSRRTTTSVVSEDGRPIMHTFYEKLKDGEDDLLEAWKAEWTRAGFEPRVLRFGDAKRHPFFEEYEKIVDPIFGRTYNALCLYRWLAIAASGGGWMCDYDTFPTNFPLEEGKNLPNNGELTSYEVHVPSLVSGSAEEWTRVAKLLIEAIPRTEEKLKSDMHNFQTLRKEGTHGIHFLPVRSNMVLGFSYHKPFTSSNLRREVDCEAMSRGRAVHLAHRYTRESFEKGMFPIRNTTSVAKALRIRGKAARRFMADWRDQCGGSNVK